MDSSDLQDFIQKCRDLCEGREEKMACVCGRFVYARVFEDENLKVACVPKSPMMEIEIQPALHPQGLHNPVVDITETGEMIRSHGEWRYASDYVNQLHAQMEN